MSEPGNVSKEANKVAEIKAKHLNLPPQGGGGQTTVTLTKTMLFAFNSGRGGASNFYAIDKATGETIFETTLDASPSATPMTYMAGGKQYIVVASGGGATKQELIALALP